MAEVEHGLEIPRLQYAGSAYIDERGRLCETVSSYYEKQILLGIKVVEAVREKRILRPTRLLSIPRGSLLPTDTLARMLRLGGDKILSYGLSTYNGEEIEDEFSIGQVPPKELIEGEVVLIVDEVADSTKTIRRASEDVAQMNPAALYTATVYDKLMPGTIRPDFVAAHTDRPDRWIVFSNEPLEEYGKRMFSEV